MAKRSTTESSLPFNSVKIYSRILIVKHWDYRPLPSSSKGGGKNDVVHKPINKIVRINRDAIAVYDLKDDTINTRTISLPIITYFDHDLIENPVAKLKKLIEENAAWKVDMLSLIDGWAINATGSWEKRMPSKKGQGRGRLLYLIRENEMISVFTGNGDIEEVSKYQSVKTISDFFKLFEDVKYQLDFITKNNK